VPFNRNWATETGQQKLGNRNWATETGQQKLENQMKSRLESRIWKLAFGKLQFCFKRQKVKFINIFQQQNQG